MADIILNVKVNSEGAESSISALSGKLNGLAKSYQSTASSTGNAENKVQSLRLGYNNLITSVKNLQDKYPAGTFDNIMAGAKSGAESVKNLNVNSADFADTAGTLGTKLKTLNADFAEIKAGATGSGGAIASHNQSIITMLPNILKWQVAMTLVMQPIQKLREAVESLNETLTETESKVTTIRRILGEASVDNQKIASSLYDIAQAYGQSFENVAEASTTFTRAGYDFQSMLDATRASMLALNVAEIDATEAADMMIAVLSQYGLEASELETVLDKMTKAADNYPVSVDKILVAMQRMGSTAANANVTLEESIALITAVSEATGRKGQNIGTSLNALLNYTTKSGALDTFSAVSEQVASIVTEYKKGAASIYDVWEALSKEINHLSAEQATLLDSYFDTEEGKALGEELNSELGDIYDTMRGVYDTAGTFRKNYFIALLNNFDTAREAIEEMGDSEGYAMSQNAQILETYDSKLASLTAKWESLANSEQGFLQLKKALVEIASVLLTIMEWTGGIKTTFLALSSIIVLVFGTKIIAGIKSAALSIKTFATSLFTAKTEAIGLGTALNSALGILGLVGTAISLVTGVVNQYKQTQSEARQESIKKWEDEKETAEELESLYGEYTKTLESNAEKDEAFYKTENKIVELLGDKAKFLEGVKNGTEEYTEEVKNLTEAERIKYQQDKKIAAEAAAKELEDWANEFSLGNGNGWRFDAHAREYGSDAESIYNSYLKRVKMRDSAYSNYLKAVRTGGEDSKTAIRWKTEWENLYNEIAEVEPLALKYKETMDAAAGAQKDVNAEGEDTNSILNASVKSAEQLAEALEEAKKEIEDAEKEQEKQQEILEKQQAVTEKQNELLKAQQKLQEAIKKAQSEYLISLIDDYIDNLEEAESIEEKQNAVLEARKEIEKSIAEAKQKALSDALKTEKQGQKDALSLEEKRLAVEKARKELLESQFQLTARIYNANTGRFEWAADKKAVDSAREAYGKSIDDYNSAIEESAWSEVEEAVENGNTDTEALKKIVNKWSAQWKGDSSPAFVDSINHAIEDFRNYAPTAEDISSATDKVKSAVTNLNDYLKNQAVKELKEYINKGNVTADGINSIIGKWLKKGEGADLYTWGNTLATTIASNIGKYDSSNSSIQSALEGVATAESNVNKAIEAVRTAQQQLLNDKIWDEASVLAQSKSLTTRDVNEFIKKYSNLGTSFDTIQTIVNILKEGLNSSSRTYVDAALAAAKTKYDNGGVLHGMGGIKATAEDEIVVPPDIAKKILTPSSNQQFHQFLEDMGILYGAAPSTAYAKRGDVITNSNSTSHSDNRSYTVNGVPISPEVAKKYSVAEVLEMAAFYN